MVIIVDRQAVSLRDPSDFTRFHVATESDDVALHDLLERTGWGSVAADGHALISIGAIRSAAEAAGVDSDWSTGFASMLDYAERKGWVTSDGDAIRAHIERGVST